MTPHIEIRQTRRPPWISSITGRFLTGMRVGRLLNLEVQAAFACAGLLSLNQGKIRCWGLSPPYVILTAPWLERERKQLSPHRPSQQTLTLARGGASGTTSSNLSFPTQPECWRYGSGV